MLDLLYRTIVMLWMPVSLGIILGDVVDRKKKWKSLLILFVIMFLLSHVIGDERGMILVMVAETVILRWGLKCPWSKLIYIFISYVEIMICNLIAELFAIHMLSFTTEQLTTVTPYKELYTIGTLLLIVAVSFLVREIIHMIRERVFTVSNEIMMLIISDAVLCTGVFLINSWVNKKVMLPEVNRIINVSMLLYVVFTFTVSAFIFKFSKEKAEIEQEKQMLEELQQYTKQVENMYNNLRSFKHDYVNVLMTLNGYLEEHDYEGMEEYFNENIMPTKERLNSDNFRLTQLSKIKQNALKGLIFSKLCCANEMGADIYIDIMDEIDQFPMNLLDLTRILGIYLDNAIEAISECDKKEIKLNIINNDDAITIIIMNTFINKGIHFERLGTHLYSTKGENRGVGLYNVKEMLKKHSNVLKQTEIECDYFVQTLILNK